MVIPSDMRYDINSVKNMCTSNSLRVLCDNIVFDTNKLSDELTYTEKNFHSKDSSSVVYKVYNGFSSIIGENRSFNRYGIAGLLQETENVINEIYNKAVSDANTIERLRREEEERLRREREERERAERERQQMAISQLAVQSMRKN